MLSQRRAVLTAVVFGLAVVAYIPTPALARPHHQGRHAAKRHHHQAPTTLDVPDDAGLSSDSLASDDALADEALGVSPAPLRGHPPTGDAGELAHWVAASDDNGDLPFMIVDKLGARIYAYNAGGEFLGSAPVLLGLARGDDSAPGIGGLQLSQISADERTTPAGRFETRWGASEGHGTMLWVDFPDAISMHPVMSVSPNEHRFQRIKSSDPDEHRISYGCINLPKTFYDDVVLTALNGGNAVVYVMPDTKPIEAVFPAAFGAPHATRMAAEDHRARHVSSADLLADEPDRVPDPEPGRFDPISDRMWMPPPM